MKQLLKKPFKNFSLKGIIFFILKSKRFWLAMLVVLGYIAVNRGWNEYKCNRSYEGKEVQYEWTIDKCKMKAEDGTWFPAENYRVQ